MKIHKLVLLFILASCGSIIYSQDIGFFFQKTEHTSFPIASGGDWKLFASSQDGNLLFMLRKNIIFKEKVNSVWVRNYDFDKNIILQQIWVVNRIDLTCKITNTTKYNLTTGSTIKTNFINDVFEPIGPNTLAESLLDTLNDFEKNEREATAPKKKPKG